MTKRSISILVLLAIVLSAFSLHVTRIGQLSYPTDLLKYLPPFVEEARCFEVIDGKTIEVEFSLPVGRREKVSLIGIDVSNTSTYDLSDLPLAITKQYLEGRKIYLSYDWEGKNEQGDLLAYAWIPVSTEVGGFYLCWNAVMLLNGFAEISDENFDTKMKIMFHEASLFAHENKSGVLKTGESQEPSNEKIQEMEYRIRKSLYELMWGTKASGAKNNQTPETYTPGVYLVGEDIESGIYSVTLIGSTGYIARLKDLTMTTESIIANQLFSGDGYVEILDRDFAVELSGVELRKIMEE